MGLIAADESDSVVLYSEGAMSFRFKKSGQRTYIQIVENKRVDGAVRQSVIANLGRADELAASGALASLLATGAKLTDQVLLINALDEDADGALSVSAKRIGGPLLFDKIWDRLGVADVLGDLLKVCGAARSFIAAHSQTVFPSQSTSPIVLLISGIARPGTSPVPLASTLARVTRTCPRMPPARAGSRATLGNPSYFQSRTTLPLRSMRRVILSAPENST